MKRLWWLFGGLVLGLVLAAGIPALVVQAGGVSMSALEGPRGLEKLVGPWLYERWVDTHAEEGENPLGRDPAAQAAGSKHYRSSCVLCHGAPGVKPSEIGQGLDPPPPDLWKADSQSMSDGQLFLVVKQGVRMTGMPAFGGTHDDRKIWQMVAFVRHLPQLTAEERKSLREAVEHLEH